MMARRAVTLYLLVAIAALAGAEDWAATDTAAQRKQPLLSRARRSQEVPTPPVERSEEALNATGRAKDLVFAHVPCNFGHTVVGLAMGSGANWTLVKESFQVQAETQAWALMQEALGVDGVMWGQMNPGIRRVDPSTLCNQYYVPGKLWPANVAESYFGNKTIFGVLRDPYDRAVNDFRQTVFGLESIFADIWRWNVSALQHTPEREGPEYQRWYKTCDVNAYLKSELGKYLAGDRYRVGCHLLPQAEFYEGRYGIALPIDNRKIPDSFNEVMQEHGYPYRMGETFHNSVCNDVSAYSLDAEAKALIRQVYARDFDLLCERFGYCDPDEMTCLEQIPDMCGSKPNASTTVR